MQERLWSVPRPHRAWCVCAIARATTRPGARCGRRRTAAIVA